jgi:hypothetical protein
LSILYYIKSTLVSIEQKNQYLPAVEQGGVNYTGEGRASPLFVVWFICIERETRGRDLPMNNWPVLALIIGVAILAVLAVMIAIYMRSKNRDKQTDYRAFFILGISFLPIGIAIDNPGIWGMGVIFLILGLANRDKWKGESEWSELGPEKRKTAFLIILGLAVLVLAGSIFYMLAR